ncbi:MAG: hypothetical protein OTI36_19370 [Beijerinckiaceae bacterium]|nr:hypothetical protein [Beijerinckiaceae bacterium]
MRQKLLPQLCRVWVCIDPTETSMMKNAALYVLFAVLDKTGGFSKKSGVTKRSMSRGTIRSFYFDAKHKGSVIRTLNAFECLFASVHHEKVIDFKNDCLGVHA